MPSSLPPILRPTRQAVTKSQVSPTRSPPKNLLQTFRHIIKNVFPASVKELRFTEDTNLDVEAKYPRREAENRMRIDPHRRGNPRDTVTPRVEEILETGDYPVQWQKLSEEYLMGVLRNMVTIARFLDLEDHQKMKQEADDFAKRINALCTKEEFVELIAHEQEAHKHNSKSVTKVPPATRAKEIIESPGYPDCLAHLNHSTIVTALTSIVTLAHGRRPSRACLIDAYTTFTRSFSVSFPPTLLISLFTREQKYHDANSPTFLDRVAPSRRLRIEAVILRAFDAADPSNSDLIEDEVFAAVKAQCGVDVMELDVLLHLLESKRIEFITTIVNLELTARQRADTGATYNQRTGKSARWLDVYTVWKNVRHEEGAMLHASFRHGRAAAETYRNKVKRAEVLAQGT